MTASDTISPGQIEIGAHLFRVDLHALEHEFGLRQRARGEAEYFRQHDPLDLPWAGGALVVFDHGLEQSRNLLAHDGGERRDVDRGDRIALLRHG